jgi:hypothetical protein
VPLEVNSFCSRYLNLFLIMALLSIQGCTTAAVAYGVSKLTTPQTGPAQQAPQSNELRTYPEYVTAMERINLEREKAGLERRPIMTQEEWVCAQKAGSPQAAPAPAPAATPASTVVPAGTPASAQAMAPAPSPAQAVAPAPATAAAPASSPTSTPAPASSAAATAATAPSPAAPATPSAEPSEKAPEAK